MILSNNILERILASIERIFGSGSITVLTDSTSSTITVEQSDANDLNTNANLQVDGVDVGTLNPIPVEVTSGGSSPSTTATHRSPSDFVATYTSNVTITLSGHPTISNSAQVSYIKVVPVSGDSAIYVNGDGTHTFNYSANVITISGATPFVTGDEYEVGINLQDKGYDSGLDINKTIEQSPLWKKYTDSEPVVSTSDIGVSDDTWIDQGSEIDCKGYKSVRPFVKLIVNNSTGNQLRILAKDEFGSIDIYEAKDAVNYEETLDNSGGTNWNIFLPYLDVTCFHSIQFQTKATLVGATEATVSIKITKEY